MELLELQLIYKDTKKYLRITLAYSCFYNMEQKGKKHYILRDT